MSSYFQFEYVNNRFSAKVFFQFFLPSCLTVNSLCGQRITPRCMLTEKIQYIHRIHKWRTRGKKLGPSHESEALEGKQKLQMKTFSELAECLARIPPKITL